MPVLAGRAHASARAARALSPCRRARSSVGGRTLFSCAKAVLKSPLSNPTLNGPSQPVGTYVPSRLALAFISGELTRETGWQEITWLLRKCQ